MPSSLWIREIPDPMIAPDPGLLGETRTMGPFAFVAVHGTHPRRVGPAWVPRPGAVVDHRDHGSCRPGPLVCGVLILLPPSEGKATPLRGRPLDLDRLSAPELTPVRERLLATVRSVSARPDALRLLGLSPGQADHLATNLSLATAPTARSDQIYAGVLYEALSFSTLSAAAKRRASTRIGIISSVFGVVRPQDRIPAYRLGGAVNLPGLGPVAAAWRECLDPTINQMAGHHLAVPGLVVDLRSSTYAAFWRPSAALAPWVAGVRVLHEKDGKRSIVSHFNKATKGRLVRALLEDGANPRSPEGLADTLRRLGWTVEIGQPGRTGTTLDVVVTTI